MAEYHDEHALCNGLRSTYRKVADETLRLLNKESEITLKNTARDFGVYQKQKIEEIFKDAVDNFYNSWEPMDDGYDRHLSLYKALDLKNAPQKDGIIDHEETVPYDSLFNPKNVTPFERGGGAEGLFEHVFKQGWHGGARGTDKRGVSMGMPHYRTPYGVYRYWGKEAVRADESPYDYFNRTLEQAYHNELNEKDKELLEYYNKIALDKVQAMIPSLFAKYS